MQTIGERIKWLRKERCRLTQEIVGRYIGVGKATIQKYEKGVISNIPSDKIVLLSEILETTPAFIMGWVDNPERFVKNTIGERNENDPLNSEIIQLLLSLSIDNQQKAIDYIRLLAMSEEKK